MIGALFKRSAERDAGRALYAAALSQARSSFLYADYGAPDTLDGRFDMLVLHVWMILHRLKGAGEQAESVSQHVFDAMFSDMDDTLREMGVGDLTVSKRIKDMAKVFYGRIEAYEAGVEDADPAALKDAVQRNVYAAPDQADLGLAAYVRAQMDVLADNPIPRMLHGVVRFADRPEAA